jgi:BASS family bile acid:Na+ symporter
MFMLMFGMGLTLTTADFRRVVRTPRATVIGTVLQLIVMPLVGLGLARAFGLSANLTAGLVVIAACPGGLYSNMFVHLARGHTALSITLTATSTMITLVTLPLWVRFALASMPGGDASLEMPVLDTALRLGGLTVLPVCLGMWLRHYRTEAVYWERRLSIASTLVIVATLITRGTGLEQPPYEDFMRSLAPVMSFAICALLVGVTLPPLFGMKPRDTVTIGVELIVKNTLLGIVLISQALPFEALIPILVFALFHSPGGFLLLAGWRLLARLGVLENELENAVDPVSDEALTPIRVIEPTR